MRKAVQKSSIQKQSREELIKKTIEAEREYENDTRFLSVRPLTDDEILTTDVDCSVEDSNIDSEINTEDTSCSEEKKIDEVVSDKKKKSKREPSKFLDSRGNLIDAVRKHKRFVFTWNNYPEDYQKYLESLQARYLICGKEVAPTTGTKHLQGYCEFSKQYRIGEFAKLVWSKTCSIENDRSSGISKFEPAFSDAESNIKYCSKDGDVFSYGEIISKGSRNDIKVIKDKIKSGCSMSEIMEEATSYQSIRMAEKFIEYHDKARNPNDPIYVIWSYGYSGTGKTYDAVKNYPDAYVKGNNTGKWFQGYDGEKKLILDEFRSSTMKYNELLGLLQPYEYVVETKGGSRQMKATLINITSHFSPTEIYPNIEEGRDQLYRRINEILFYGGTERKKVFDENGKAIKVNGKYKYQDVPIRNRLVLDMSKSVKERSKIIKAFCEKFKVIREEDSSSEEVDIDELYTPF